MLTMRAIVRVELNHFDIDLTASFRDWIPFGFTVYFAHLNQLQESEPLFCFCGFNRLAFIADFIIRMYSSGFFPVVMADFSVSRDSNLRQVRKMQKK